MAQLCNRLLNEGFILFRGTANHHRHWRADRGVCDRCKNRSDHRRDDEQPELLQRPSSNDQRWAKTASRINGGVSYGNSNEVNNYQHKSNWNAPESCRSLAVGGTEDGEN